uniref:FBD domain-containing protein n=1 Tax=Solanum lycopersicum TaxID=4081 RepID=A0A3Q7J848_SOLLC
MIEKLSIHESQLLTQLEIVGPLCSNLKILEIGDCYDCDFIKIHNVNFVSFKYIGSRSFFIKVQQSQTACVETLGRTRRCFPT